MFRNPNDGTGVATQLGVLTRAAGVLLLSGCLLPAPIEQAVEMENRPPRLEAVFPPIDVGPRFMDPDCDEGYEFTVRMSDPDVDDQIYWRVFLDYHNPANRPQAHSPTVSRETLTSEEPAIVRFTVFPDEFPGSNPLDPSFNPHVVEVLVADRDFITNASPEGRAVPEEAFLDSVQWTVVLDPMAECQTGM